MPCIKCGRKVTEGQVFCAACLENAEKYPIKPGTPVQLPPRAPVVPVKHRPKKPELRPEEQVRQLRNANRWLTLVLVVLLIGFALIAALLLVLMEQKALQLPIPWWMDRLAVLWR